MAEVAPGAQPSDKRPSDRLDSWKEIAAYMSRDVTTVQRWEKREGMPVHRHLHARMGSVYASRAELDAWARSRKPAAAQEDETIVPSPEPTESSFRKTLRSALPLAVVIAALAVAGYLFLQRKEYFWHSPIADARYQTVTDFDGVAEAAAISRDGQVDARAGDHIRVRRAKRRRHHTEGCDLSTDRTE